MINIIEYKTYWEEMPQREDRLKHVIFGTDESDLKRQLPDISPEQQPFAFVLIPSAVSSGSQPDNFSETNRALFYVLAKEDSFSLTTFDIQVNTQPVAEAVKEILITDKSPCSMLRNLNEGSFHTDPESAISSKCSGWSVSFEF